MGIKRKISFIILLWCVHAVGNAALSPLTTVRHFWDDIRATQATAVVDMETFCAQALTTHWASWSKEQRQEFQDLFGKVFVQKLVDLSKRQEFSSWNQATMNVQRHENSFSHVKVLHQRDGKTVPLEFYLRKHENHWRVFGLSIDGVDLTRNYRSQFLRILQEEGYAGLIERLHKKVSSAM